MATDDVKYQTLRAEVTQLLTELAGKSLASKMPFDAQKDSYSRQVDYDDALAEYYAGRIGSVKVLRPTYAPQKMYELLEQCGVLEACVTAYIRNIDGYGQEMVAIDGETSELDSAGLAEKELLDNLFDQPNDEESFSEIRDKFRRDFEATGNAYLEAVRDMDGRVALVFWADAKRTRLCPLDDEPVIVAASILRGKTEVPITKQKRFRRFCMVTVTGSSDRTSVRYFKQFGDARAMNALTGEYLDDAKLKEYTQLKASGAKVAFELATEILHYKYGNRTYGYPRWIANLTEVLGISNAKYVNYDLFDNQGIPPLMIMVNNAKLTAESLQDLKQWLIAAKGAANFNRILLLETESTIESLSSDGKTKSSTGVIDVKPTAEYRKEDAMFTGYLNREEASVRQYGFRLPEMFVGISKDYNRATAEVCREVTEDQVFGPERNSFDSFINSTIIKSYKVSQVRFQSKRPRVVSLESLLGMIENIASNAGLTTNELIKLVNDFYGTEFQSYKEDWANLPIPAGLEILKKDLGITTVPVVAPPVPEKKTPKEEGAGLKEPVAKSDDELQISELYDMLQGIEKIAKARFSPVCNHLQPILEGSDGGSQS